MVFFPFLAFKESANKNTEEKPQGPCAFARTTTNFGSGAGRPGLQPAYSRTSADKKNERFFVATLVRMTRYLSERLLPLARDLGWEVDPAAGLFVEASSAFAESKNCCTILRAAASSILC